MHFFVCAYFRYLGGDAGLLRLDFRVGGKDKRSISAHLESKDAE